MDSHIPQMENLKEVTLSLTLIKHLSMNA